MSPSKILCYPNKNLQKKVPQIEIFDDNLQHEITRVLETLSAVQSQGLAAPQIGILSRFIVIQLKTGNPLCMVNPELIKFEGSIQSQESSLSLPGLEIQIPRANQITVRYQDHTGAEQEMMTEGPLSCVIQRKIDHINGILVINYLSKLKLSRLLKKYDKYLASHLECGDHSCGHAH